MTATFRLIRKWGGVTDRHGKWEILIDGTGGLAGRRGADRGQAARRP